MKRIVYLMLSVLALLGCMTVASASEKEDAAKGMVKKAVAFLKKDGKDQALAEFNKGSGQFNKGELYIFVFDPNGVMLAHGANQKLVGKNMLEVKDPDGRYLTKDTIKVAKQGGGWIEYKWTNPETKKIAPKVTYAEAVGDLTVGCGFFK